MGEQEVLDVGGIDGAVVLHQLAHESVGDALDHDVPLPGAVIQRPMLCDKHHLAVLLVSALVLLALVQDPVVVGLGDADELTVVTLGPHHP